MRTTLIACSAAVILLFTGCGRDALRVGGAGGGRTVDGGGGNPGGGSLRSAGGAMGGAGGNSATGGGRGGASARGGSGGSSTWCASICSVDFPCRVTGEDQPRCVAGRSDRISHGVEVSCQEACGTPCCSGGACRIQTDLCPLQTVCVYPSGSKAAKCVSTAQACGGYLGNTCKSNEYCEYLGGLCNEGSCPWTFDRCAYVSGGATGVCAPLSNASGCSNVSSPVCGCDGVTYRNDCARRAVGAVLGHSGACTGGGGGAAGTVGRGGAAGGARGGAGGASALGGAGGSPGAGGNGGTGVDGGTVPTPLGQWSDSFCVGQDSKISLAGKTWTVPATSKWTDPQLSCCTAYAVRMHAQEAVGTGLDVVIRFPSATATAGTYTFGGGSSAIIARLRLAAAHPDGGWAEPAALSGGVVVAGTPEDGTHAWQMGLCASVDETSSYWRGLRVYVPVVSVAPPSWGSRFRLWLFKDPSVRATDLPSGGDLSTYVLASDPLLDLMDVDYVRLSAKTFWLGLNSPFKSASTLQGKLRGYTGGLYGVPFVVEADGQRIYAGAFTTSISSIGAPGAGIVIEDITDEGFAIEPPYAAAGTPANDLRSDPRIVKVLSEAGKAVP